jgi:hypothetical protein
VGAAVLGGVLTFQMARPRRAHAPGSPLSLDSVQHLLDGRYARGPAPDPAALAVLRAGLSESLHLVYWVVFAAAVITLLTSWQVPELQRVRD